MSIKHKEIADLRMDYTKQRLDESDLKNNPIEQFELWMQQAIENNVTEPTAMVLSTVDAQGFPSSRIVLLKDYQEDGFYFFTNYLSKKGQDISVNSNVSLLFFWSELQRQVRIHGQVSVADKQVSDDYFASRPKESKIGAIASPQSQKIASRKELEDRVSVVADQYRSNNDVPRPAFWGGYRVEPNYIEFWQGGGSRLHDRLIYEKEEAGHWVKYRVAP